MSEVLLRSANAGDAELLFQWANDATVRANAFSQEGIAWGNHQRWLATKLSDGRCRIFIMEDPNGTPVGQIRFDIAEEEAEVDVSIVATARGEGLGAAIIREGATRLFAESAVRRIIAFVKKSNTSSKEAFLKAGFELADETTRAGEAVVRIILQRRQ